MAESKRNSVADKIATPKAGGGAGAQPVDALEALGKAIGARVRLTTVAPHSQRYEGTLFTPCPILNVVAINTRISAASSAAQLGDYHIIPVSRIRSFHLVSLTASDWSAENNDRTFANAVPAIGPVDTKRLEEREEAKIRKLKEDEANKGKDVTKEGQAIFGALKRVNIPIRWHNQEMIVHEAVIISPPYRPEDCKGSKERQQVLNQTKKILEGERRKLRDKEEREAKAAAPLLSSSAPRKGG